MDDKFASAAPTRLMDTLDTPATRISDILAPLQEEYFRHVRRWQRFDVIDLKEGTVTHLRAVAVYGDGSDISKSIVDRDKGTVVLSSVGALPMSEHGNFHRWRIAVADDVNCRTVVASELRKELQIAAEKGSPLRGCAKNAKLALANFLACYPYEDLGSRRVF